MAEVDRALVLKVVKPIRNDKPETGKRVKDRIKLVLSWEKAHAQPLSRQRSQSWQ